MIEFTNLKSKALSLVALMALGTASVFAQNPYGNSQFEDATKDATLTTAKKIFLYDGVSDKYATFPYDTETGGLVKGVSIAVGNGNVTAIDPATGLFQAASASAIGDLPFQKIEPESPDDVNSSYWFANGKLNLFTRNDNPITVVFDFSTKYLQNARNIRMTLGENLMGSVPTLKTKWNLTTYVYNMDGTPCAINTIYKSQASNTSNVIKYTDAAGLQVPVFELGANGAVGAKDNQVTLFVNDQDNNTEDLIPYSIDNKIIRVVLTMDMPTQLAVGGHFLPALTIANCGIEFEKPSLGISVDNTGEFNAGACFRSDAVGKLNFYAKHVTAVEDYTLINIYRPSVDFIEYTGEYADEMEPTLTGSFPTFEYKSGAEADSVAYETNYRFKPQSISSGTFVYAANLNADLKDALSPIRLSTQIEEAIAYNSKPVFHIAEDHIKFNNSEESKDVVVSGYNIPCVIPTYVAYEKWTTDQREEYAGIKVENHYTLDAAGKIINDPKHTGALKNPHLHIDYSQWINDLSRDEAFIIKVEDGSEVELPNGRKYGYSPEFGSLIARGNVAQLWFTYLGESVIGTPAITPDNVFFSRHDASQPYDASRYASRIKKYMLHGADFTKLDGNHTINVAINLTIGGLNTNQEDHLEMRYTLKDPSSADFTVSNWTNATQGTLYYALNTADSKQVQDFYTTGIPVYVQYVPRCDGFEKGATSEAGYEYGWNPHEYVLSATANDASSTHDNTKSEISTKVNLYGDTRAVLATNINELNPLYVMGGTQSLAPIGEIVKDWFWGASAGNIVVPSFRKSYGDIYLNCANSNYWEVDSFVVAGYNLKKNVQLVHSHNTPAYPGAFTVEVSVVAGNAAASTIESLVPNEYGELFAVVKVYFAKNDIAKVAGKVKAEDVVTVSYADPTIMMKEQDKRKDYDAAKDKKSYYDFFNIAGTVINNGGQDNVEDQKKINGFNYVAFSESAEVYGFIYKPTLSIEFEGSQNLDAHVGQTATSLFWVKGSEFNPLNARTVTLALTEAGTPFTISAVGSSASINDAGSFAAQYALNYAPVTANLCKQANTISLSAQCAEEQSADVTGVPSWNDEAGFTINDLKFGDIDGSMANVSWTAMPGAQWYQVEVGHWAPKFTSEDVFISECKAAVGTDEIVVEVFNGTGKVINPTMMVNYYLTFEQIDAKTGKVLATVTPAKGSNLDNVLLNTSATKDGWKTDAIKFVYNTPINNNYTYNVKLMQGETQMDIFTFGQAGAHLARIAGTYDADGKLVTGATINRNKGAFDISKWETTHTSLPVAHFAWSDYTYFDLSDGGRSNMIKGQNTVINNLKPNRTYDLRVLAFHDCIVDSEGNRIPQTTERLDFLTMSEYAATSGEITFSNTSGTPTGNETIDASSVNVYSQDGKIFVSGAEGAVKVVDMLGATAAQVSAEAAAQGISVNGGIYIVNVNGKGIKCVVK